MKKERKKIVRVQYVYNYAYAAFGAYAKHDPHEMIKFSFEFYFISIFFLSILLLQLLTSSSVISLAFQISCSSRRCLLVAFVVVASPYSLSIESRLQSTLFMLRCWMHVGVPKRRCLWLHYLIARSPSLHGSFTSSSPMLWIPIALCWLPRL